MLRCSRGASSSTRLRRSSAKNRVLRTNRSRKELTAAPGWEEEAMGHKHQRLAFRAPLVVSVAAAGMVAFGGMPAEAAVWHGVPFNKVTQWSDGHGCTYQAAYGWYYASYTKARVAAVAPHTKCRVDPLMEAQLPPGQCCSYTGCIGWWTTTPADWCVATMSEPIKDAQFHTSARTPKGRFSADQYWYPK